MVRAPTIGVSGISSPHRFAVAPGMILKQLSTYDAAPPRAAYLPALNAAPLPLLYNLCRPDPSLETLSASFLAATRKLRDLRSLAAPITIAHAGRMRSKACCRRADTTLSRPHRMVAKTTTTTSVAVYERYRAAAGWLEAAMRRSAALASIWLRHLSPSLRSTPSPSLLLSSQQVARGTGLRSATLPSKRLIRLLTKAKLPVAAWRG